MTATTGFLSWGTLISGALAVLLWGLEWNWRAGLLVVILLYIHEAGHILAARWRRVPVWQAPFFVPGLGAFVVTSPTSRPWDRVAISLGGPLIGGAAALAVKLAGIAWNMPAVAFAGDFMLLVNLLNLAPFGALDGGQITAISGRFGRIAEWVVGLIFVLTGGPVLLVLGVITLAAQLRGRAKVKDPDGRISLAIIGLYLNSVAALAATTIITPTVFLPASGRPAWMPDPQTLMLMFGLALMISNLALGRAWSPKWRGPSRYLVGALLGWPQLLLHQPAEIPVMGCLAAHLLRMPGLAWLRKLIRGHAARGDETAGIAIAQAYDCLIRQGQASAASAWLTEHMPLARGAGHAVLGAVYANLTFLGHHTAGMAWLTEALDPDQPVPPLPHHAANLLAWCFLQMGRPEAALPVARSAVEAEPYHPGYLDTLGQVQLALGDASAAEAPLRESLAGRERPGTRIALARALVAQGKFADAVIEAEKVLSRRKAVWPADAPSPDQVRAWVDEWRVHVLPAENQMAVSAWYGRKLQKWRKVQAKAVLLVAVAVVIVGAARYRSSGKPPADWPHSLQGEWTTVYGGETVSSERLEEYGQDFARIRPEVGWHLGITCPVLGIEVYDSEAAWNRRDLGMVAAAYDPDSGRIAIADWRSAPGLQTRAMVEQYVGFCVREFNGKDLPRWFVRGLALNESYRVDEGRPDVNTLGLRTQWEAVTGRPKGTPVPKLAWDRVDDAFAATAVGHLMQTRGDGAVKRFLDLTAELKPFGEAFTEAFGVTPLAYQAEYDQAIRSASPR